MVSRNALAAPSPRNEELGRAFYRRRTRTMDMSRLLVTLTAAAACWHVRLRHHSLTMIAADTVAGMAVLAAGMEEAGIRAALAGMALEQVGIMLALVGMGVAVTGTVVT